MVEKVKTMHNAENSSENLVESGNSVSSDSKWELTRIIFDFLSKCLYPALIAVAMWIVYPVAKSVDINSLVSRISTAELAGGVVKFELASDLAKRNADVNGKITRLENSLADLQSDLNGYMKLSGVMNLDNIDIETRNARDEQFAENGKYTVLVFSQDDIIAIDKASVIEQSLLQSGYKSSNTTTDFSELEKIHPSGTVYVTHNGNGASILDSIKNMLEELSLDMELKVQQSTTDLNNGDIQILVF